MKKKLITLTILFFLLVVFGSGLFLLMVTKYDWSEKSRKIAPGGKYIAFHMESMSEAGVAPYGDHLVLVPKYRLLGQYYMEPLLAGYCRDLEYQWLDSVHLRVSCDSEDIMKKVIRFKDIHIEYVSN